MQVIYVPSQDVRQSQESRFARYDVPDGVTDFELPPIELVKPKNVAVGH